jgi:hypothetical protein
MKGWSLTAASIVFGWVTVWVVRHTTNVAEVRIIRNRIFAHLLELRLFAAEPGIIWKAQRSLIVDNLRFCALMLPPALILALPTAWLLTQLDSIYGFEPLAMGKAAIVTAQLGSELKQEDQNSSLAAPPGILVETPPVRSLKDRQVSWQIRAVAPASGSLRLSLQGISVEKTITAGRETTFLSRRRDRSLWSFLLHPQERRIATDDVSWVEIDYPKADIHFLGLELPWITWFLIVSSLSALVSVRRPLVV